MRLPKCPDWLREAVFYQVYPQSFYDTNGDGIGDLEGITRKLDYIQSLGCNALWINPCFVSPFMDAGYDVADYYRIAPRYGTNADMKRLLKASAQRSIRVCLDLVPGHTSVEHPWFRASCQAQPNKHSDWYIWTSHTWDNNDNSLSLIRGYAQRDGNYLTNFFWCQPALNYGFVKPNPKFPWQKPITHPACRAVKREMMNIMRYWLDRGVSGFRVDMAASLMKGLKSERPMMDFWQEMRRMLDRDYPEAVLISEWSKPQCAIPAGFHVDFLLHFPDRSAYNCLLGRTVHEGRFFNREGGGNIDDFMNFYMDQYKKTRSKGYMSFVTSNHDMTRPSDGRNQRDMELLFALVMTMPGVPFIYYGDEIGMRYQRELFSKEGGYDRTGSRTPMQWSAGRNADFSTGKATDLYLPVDARAGRPTVAGQDADPKSLLNQVRGLVALRKATPALGADGEFVPLFAKSQKYPLVYLRRMGRQRIVVAINPCAKPVTASFKAPASDSPRQLCGHGVELNSRAGRYTAQMSGVSFGVWEL